MYRILIMMTVLCFVASSVFAEGKIGFVNVPAVIAKCEAGKRAMNELKGKFQGMKKKLDAKKKELDAMKEELQKQAMMLSQEAKLDKETQFKRKVRDFQDMGQGYQVQLQQAEQKLSKPILEKLVQVIQDYGKRHGYTAILDKQGSGVTYVAPEADLTEAIIAEMNKAMP